MLWIKLTATCYTFEIDHEISVQLFDIHKTVEIRVEPIDNDLFSLCAITEKGYKLELSQERGLKDANSKAEKIAKIIQSPLVSSESQSFQTLDQLIATAK